MHGSLKATAYLSNRVYVESLTTTYILSEKQQRYQREDARVIIESLTTHNSLGEAAAIQMARCSRNYRVFNHIHSLGEAAAIQMARYSRNYRVFNHIRSLGAAAAIKTTQDAWITESSCRSWPSRNYSVFILTQPRLERQVTRWADHGN